jgi:hypothetical protein
MKSSERRTYTIKDINDRTMTMDHLRILDQLCGREASTSGAFTTPVWEGDPSAAAGAEPATGVSALEPGVVILPLRKQVRGRKTEKRKRGTEPCKRVGRTPMPRPPNNCDGA